MPRTTKNAGGSISSQAVDDVGTDLTGIVNFTTEPTIGQVGLRSYVGWSDAATSPATAMVENMPRGHSTLSTLTAFTTGTLRLVYLPLQREQIITSLAFTAVGAGSGLTNQWFALLDSTRRVLAFTSDDLTTAWGANTRKSLNLTAPWTVTYTGLHYAAILVAASGMPTMAGMASSSPVTGQAPILGGNTTDTGLTTVPALPFTAGVITSSGQLPYCAAS